MVDKKVLRVIYLYEFKLNHSAPEAARNIEEVFGKGTAPVRTVQRWFTRFRSGDESLDNDVIPGRPSGVNDEVLRKIIEENPSKTTRDIARELGVSNSTICHHLAKLGKVKRVDRWVPQEMNGN
ncbi:unnamed protein product [Bursaphelenchus okinawaensis]|uniref:HTH_48 domain-containing protein n=1 Tax=Bursaphelenchus okinawaensis TaxID=465554 RepID=A0A811JUW9_9BILA|nr:unnamed protein product [Bursaphelenchus okinawaensis]CAG9084771.1 unnamed protein product [Bursaphelenchus okinawaensis]